MSGIRAWVARLTGQTAAAEEIQIPTSASLRAHHERAWAELPEAQRRRTVDAARAIVRQWNEPTLIRIRAEIRASPDDWATPYHFAGGMAFRNALRDAGVKDDQFPTGNLDDYYVKAIELALEGGSHDGR